MSDDKNGGAAFPRPCSFGKSALDGGDVQILQQKGMTLRDWFAGMALQGILAASDDASPIGLDTAAVLAYDAAAQMLTQRTERGIDQ